jgi:hypothetical protein
MKNPPDLPGSGVLLWADNGMNQAEIQQGSNNRRAWGIQGERRLERELEYPLGRLFGYFLAETRKYRPRQGPEVMFY